MLPGSPEDAIDTEEKDDRLNAAEGLGTSSRIVLLYRRTVPPDRRLCTAVTVVVWR